MNPLNSSEQKKEFGRKPEVNEAARIVNSHFLQSPYEGKDWESVRKDIIEELTTYIAKHTQEAYKKGYADKGIEELLKHENDKGNQV